MPTRAISAVLPTGALSMLLPRALLIGLLLTVTGQSVPTMFPISTLSRFVTVSPNRERDISGSGRLHRKREIASIASLLSGTN